MPCVGEVAQKLALPTQQAMFFPECVATHTRSTRRRNQVSLRKNLGVQECFFCSKTYCSYDRKSNKYKFISKGLNQRTLEDCGVAVMSKYRKVLVESVNVISTNRGLRTIEHGRATFEQTKKCLFNFYPERFVENDGLHKTPTFVKLSF